MSKSKLKDKLAARQNALRTGTEPDTSGGSDAPEMCPDHSAHKEKTITKIGGASSDKLRKPEKIRRIQTENYDPRIQFTNKSYFKELEDKQEEKYEETIQASTTKQFNTKFARKRPGTGFRKAVTGLLILLCAYMAFLIFGVITTEYTYDDNNEVMPKRVSLQEISEMKEFNVLATQYYSCRALYEQVLLLDCRYIAAESQEEKIIIGSEYWKALDTVESLIVQINALTVPSKYENIKSQLLTWTQTYIAVYCQNMSYSISNNSEQDLQKALEYQELTYNGFQIITTNLASMGAQVNGAESDVENISSWSPSRFVQEQSGGIFN